MLSRSVPLSIKPDPVDLRDSIKSGAPVGHILHANFMRDVGVVRKCCLFCAIVSKDSKPKLYQSLGLVSHISFKRMRKLNYEPRIRCGGLLASQWTA